MMELDSRPNVVVIWYMTNNAQGKQSDNGEWKIEEMPSLDMLNWAIDDVYI